MNHSFDIEIASIYSVDIAIFLNHIAFWTQKNIANNKHFHKGYFWTYNSYSAFLDIFPYWSIKNIRTIISNILSEKLLLKDNFNTQKYDQTNWYALSDLGLRLFPLVLQQFNTAMSKPATEAGLGLQEVDLSEPTPSLSCPNRQMDLPVPANGSAQTGRPIPDTKTNTKTDIKNLCASSPKSTLNGFNLFWENYPSKKAKKKCLEIWKRRKLEFIADEINQKLQLQIQTDEQWLKGFIPNPSTYLNQDRWNDEITIPKTSMRDKELAEKKRKADERILEQEKRSKELSDYEANKHRQYNADGKAFREIRSKVVKEAKEAPEGFKKLKESLGMKS